MQFGINKHEQIFQRLTKLLEPVGRVQFGVFEKFTSAYLFQIAREIIWLLINNIHKKISRCLSSRNACVSRNQENAPSRACAWFESKRFDWPSVSFVDHWPIRMLGLFPVLHWINSFLLYFQNKKKTALLLTNQNGEIFSCILLETKTSVPPSVWCANTYEISRMTDSSRYLAVVTLRQTL